MHFNGVVIICAVYFLTSAWSIGLNSRQLKPLIKLFEDHKGSKKEISEQQIAHVVEKSFGMELKDLQNIYEHDSNSADSLNLRRLLTKLADFEVKTLTPFEVNVYTNEFMGLAESYQQPGCLTLQQLPSVFKYWKMVNVKLIEKSEKLIAENGVDYLINVAEFLLIMLEIKPVGRGLTLAQIGMFDTLYKVHRITPDTIDPMESEKVFIKLGITITDELKQLFESGRSAGKLLLDLIVTAAELTVAVETNDRKVLDPTEIIYIIHNYDVNNDGKLEPDEYSEIKEEAINFLKSMMYTAETMKIANIYAMKLKGGGNINMAEFMEMISFYECLSQDSLVLKSDN